MAGNGPNVLVVVNSVRQLKLSLFKAASQISRSRSRVCLSALLQVLQLGVSSNITNLGQSVW